MDLTTIVLLLIAAETSYLTWAHLKPNTTKIEAQSILLDTSVLIDGRIESIARSGLISAPLVVPRSVVRELQYMADKADHDKRERARYGLDMIEKLQGIDPVTVTVLEDGALEDGGVDERLVTLAKASNARLCTTDYNLNKAARVQGVVVLNINEIAHALRIVRLPGEQTVITLQQPGQERDQAVGYMDDGTMVVVDNGRIHMGEAVTVEVTRALQTVAGKMLFAKLVASDRTPNLPKRTQPARGPKKPRVEQRPQIQSQPATTAQERPQRPDNRQSQRNRPQPTQKPIVNQPNELKPQDKQRRPRKKSMTDRAEASLVDLLNKQ